MIDLDRKKQLMVRRRQSSDAWYAANRERFMRERKAVRVRAQAESRSQPSQGAVRAVVVESSSRANPARCSGQCRWDVVDGRRWFHYQPYCPKHDPAHLYDPAFDRKPQSFTAVETEVL